LPTALHSGGTAVDEMVKLCEFLTAQPFLSESMSVCLSVSHTRESRLNGSKYQNTLHIV